MIKDLPSHTQNYYCLQFFYSIKVLIKYFYIIFIHIEYRIYDIIKMEYEFYAQINISHWLDNLITKF